MSFYMTCSTNFYFAVTSGDTGSSALYSMQSAANVSTVVMYPHNMISEVQKLMMTTVQDPTAHVFAGYIYIVILVFLLDCLAQISFGFMFVSNSKFKANPV